LQRACFLRKKCQDASKTPSEIIINDLIQTFETASLFVLSTLFPSRFVTDSRGVNDFIYLVV